MAMFHHTRLQPDSNWSCFSPSADEPRKRYEGLGLHLIGEFYEVSAAVLRNEEFLMNAILEMLQNTNLTILSHISHKFPGEESGVTGFVLLGESHVAFHSFPEYNYLSADLFTCGPLGRTLAAVEKLLEKLGRTLEANKVHIVSYPRGVLIPPEKISDHSLHQQEQENEGS